LSVPDWADRFRVKARGAGSTSGRWRTSDVEIARGPMLAPTEPGVREISVMACTQLMKTSVIENTFGQKAHIDPCPMMIVQPKESSALKFSKERIAPMIEATPALQAVMRGRRVKADNTKGKKSRSADDTLDFKQFVGGFLAIEGAGSEDNLARRPVRVLLFDEIDKYPDLAQGDAITLGEARLATYVDGLSIRVCSPTQEDDSRIAILNAKGDQRRASAQCPHCGHRQFLDFFKHVHWDRNEETGEHFPETAELRCEACSALWSEADRLAALRQTRWHQTRPFKCGKCGTQHSPLDDYALAWADPEETDPIGRIWDWWASDMFAVYRAKCRTCGKWSVSNRHASFQASKMFSPWPADRPVELAIKFVDAGNNEEMRQAFWQNELGLPYRPRIGKDVKPDVLMERLEVWPGDVPPQVAFLTAGVDVQPDRLEIEIVGWGLKEESWQIAYEVLEGDADRPEVWDRLDQLLQREWLRADGYRFTVMAACIDSGGANTQAVYSFCRTRWARRIYAIKGMSEESTERSPVWPSVRRMSRQKADFKPVMIGTNAAKDRISNCLAIEAPGPGYMHFPAGLQPNYFIQLTAERLKPVKTRNGRTRRAWVRKRDTANEALDCRVYAYAAYWALVISHGISAELLAQHVGATTEALAVIKAGTPEAQRIEAMAPPEPDAAPATSAETRRRRRRVVQSAFVTGR
jgi:phage terminase large subunit GpA-like protein